MLNKHIKKLKLKMKILFSINLLFLPVLIYCSYPHCAKETNLQNKNMISYTVAKWF